MSEDDGIEVNGRLLNNNFLKKELIFKIVVIGEFGVGKTSIIRRYTKDEFSTSYKVTIGADFAVKIIDWDENTQINLNLWDIAGFERFGSLTGVFYRHAVAAAIVFDLTRPETFNSIDKWLIDLRNKVHLPGNQPLPVIILANKGDIALQNVHEKEISDYCRKNNILTWLITSAKCNIHIDKAVEYLIDAAMRNHLGLQLPMELNDTVKLQNSKLDQKHKKCCNS